MSASSSAAATPASSQQQPNFVPKLDAKEQARMNAMMSNLKANQKATCVTGETGVTRTIALPSTTLPGGGGIDLSAVHTLYFRGCKNSSFTVDDRATKVFIDDCHDCKFFFNKPLLTQMLEAWKVNNIEITSKELIKTYQLDLADGIAIHLPSIAQFDTAMLVWNSVEKITVTFSDNSAPALRTGYAEMSAKFSDSSKQIDQFIVRFQNDEKEWLEERCIRLQNGFLSTEREAVAWEKKNELLKERFVENFLKEGGIRINKKPEKKIPPNDPCPCGSGSKYKKCCMNKKVLTGVQGDHVATLYGKNTPAADAASSLPSSSSSSSSVDATSMSTASTSPATN